MRSWQFQNTFSHDLRFLKQHSRLHEMGWLDLIFEIFHATLFVDLTPVAKFWRNVGGSLLLLGVGWAVFVVRGNSFGTTWLPFACMGLGAICIVASVVLNAFRK
jgi:hypothetical protein